MGEGGTGNLWQALRTAIQDILEKGESRQHFADLYLSAYAMVVQDQGALLHGGLREVVIDHLVNKVRPGVLASPHDAFLRALNQAWNDHQTRMNRIRDIVRYLEQVHVPRYRVCSVHKLGVLLFRDEVARHGDILPKLQECLLQTMSRDREGEMVDRLSVKNACQMLGKLGVNSRSVYEEDFERPYLAESAKFYALESQKQLAAKSAIDYIDMAEQRINEESQRAKLCLDPGTERLIQQVVFQELVASHVNSIVAKEDSGVVALLKNQRVGDLTRIFRLLSRAENGRRAVTECVSNYLRGLGRSLMAEDGDKADSLCLVKKLFDLKYHYEHILNTCFNDEFLVKKIISADFEYILSLNRKSPEYVALFADDMLRKGIKGMAEQEIKQLLDKIIVFVRFLHEKDLFENFYRQTLCKRLLLNQIVSQEAESTMVNKLKAEFGAVFVSKFEAMLRDLSLSRTMAEEFKNAVASCKLQLHGLDLNVRVLTTGFWPFRAATQRCNIPTAPLDAFRTFRRFYLAKYNDRRLDLQPQLGWVDMRAVFYPPGEPSASSALPIQPSGPRKYVILVSTYQMCVLMLFNSRDKITYEDIASETGIPETNLVNALESLTVGKAARRILVKEPPTNDFGPGHVFAVNETFTSDLNKVKVHMAAKKGVDSKGNESATRNVVEDRRFVTDAAIVRIMKSEQRLSLSELLTKLTELLSARFTPNPEAVKKRIDALIEREYLERAPENAEVYVYVP
ncbi:hypothetical protein V5799_005688 [Amblyomma americanum]|uniref:Cullin family profile domain-containing protein n=1 Tax=Amblyomma americanum TaxID=6943 RepID=A0AAQ4DYI7_AMBAM